jgi:trimeric autotransporter adhesin
MHKQYPLLVLTAAVILLANRLPAQQRGPGGVIGSGAIGSGVIGGGAITFRPQNTGLQAYTNPHSWHGLDLALFWGTANTATGTQALNSCTNCYENVADGYQALYSCTTCNSNVAVGFQALYAATTGSDNTAVGWAALNINSSGVGNAAFGNAALESNASGSYNTALGANALEGGTGSNNTAVGSGAFANAATETYSTAVGTNAMSESHASAGYNVAIGYGALFGYIVQGQGGGNTGGYNVAAGANALKNNTTGAYNAAIGYEALIQNSSGNFNIASGPLVGYQNTTGEFLVASGFAALYSNTTGSGNTGIGTEALFSNTTGSNNTALGCNASTASGALTNAMALGYTATVSSSNQVVVGNSSVTSIGGYANWTNFSDGRYKRNIQQNVPGLAFINKLNPVTYTLDIAAIEAKLHEGQPSLPASVAGGSGVAGGGGVAGGAGAPGAYSSPSADPVMKQAMQEKSAVTYTGFVAQEVEKAADSLGFVFSGIDKPKDINKSFYGLRYGDFVPALVRAVQELSAASDKKDSAINALTERIDSAESKYATLQTQVNELRAMLLAQKATASGTSSPSTASLDQNAPNPFTGSTVIGYSLPKGASSAQMQITDASGKVLALIPLSPQSSGKNTLRADVSGYASGIYNYSLIIDGKLAGTKQMISVR